MPVRAVELRLLHEDEHGAPRVAEPRGAQPGDLGGAGGEELDTLFFECGAGRVEVVADQTDMRDAGVRDRHLVGRPQVEVRILDELYDSVAVVGTEDRRGDDDRRWPERVPVA